MDGATLLRTIRKNSPDTVRILLTGHWDLNAAIVGVNEGDFFRVLTKPCPPHMVVSAMEAAAAQYGLIKAERVLLEETLCRTIEVMMDVLCLANPTAFGRTARVTMLVSDLAAELSLPDRWQVEVAAMLYQLGAVVLHPETAEKAYGGQVLSSQEHEALERLPAFAAQRLRDIPRLEPVREILETCKLPRGAKPTSETVRMGAQILKAAIDLDDLERSGKQPRSAAVEALRGGDVDPTVLEALVALSVRRRSVSELPLAAIREGMVLAEDVRAPTGALLAVSGYSVTTAFLERARNIASLAKPVLVFDSDGD
jgi:hypothetical protein